MQEYLQHMYYMSFAILIILVLHAFDTVMMVYRIKNLRRELLADIKRSRNFLERALIEEGVISQITLEDIVNDTDEFIEVRQSAIARLTNQAFLEKIVETFNRKTTLEKFVDESFDRDFCRAAENRLKELKNDGRTSA